MQRIPQWMVLTTEVIIEYIRINGGRNILVTKSVISMQAHIVNMVPLPVNNGQKTILQVIIWELFMKMVLKDGWDAPNVSRPRDTVMVSV